MFETCPLDRANHSTSFDHIQYLDIHLPMLHGVPPNYLTDCWLFSIVLSNSLQLYPSWEKAQHTSLATPFHPAGPFFMARGTLACPVRAGDSPDLYTARAGAPNSEIDWQNVFLWRVDGLKPITNQWSNALSFAVIWCNIMWYIYNYIHILWVCLRTHTDTHKYTQTV